MIGSCVEHNFSVEIISKQHLRNISISDESRDLVFFEGTLGEPVGLSMEEGDVLEIVGSKGVLRVSVSEGKLWEILQKNKEKISRKGESI